MKIKNVVFKVFQKHTFALLALAYFSFRLINLTMLPPFNDESIYLDWGWRMTHEPGELFYSLYDGKQPLVMWLFGIAASIISSPFFVGRAVSVVFGFVTLLGIYKLGTTYFHKNIAIIASAMYIVIPIFVFYDRQALMESALCTVGTWVLWYGLKAWKTQERMPYAQVGLLLGLGFFTKSTAMLFFVVFVFMTLFLGHKYKNLQRSLFGLILLGVSFLISISLLLLQPRFWQTLATNNRYGFSLSELFEFPIGIWTTNFLSNSNILFVFLTPFILFFGVAGMILILKKQDKVQKNMVVWFLLLLMLQILIVKGTSQRYLVAILPVFCFFAAVGVQKAFFLSKNIGKLFFFITLCLPVVISCMLVFAPLFYFSSLRHVSSAVDYGGYVSSYNAGYGLEELIAYMKILQEKEGKRIFVGTSLYTGNPESGLMVAFQNKEDITVGYFDESLFKGQLDDIECLTSDVPIYFVSKSNQVPGITRFLTHMTDIHNAVNKSIFGIWKLKDPCVGKTLPISLVNL